MHEYFVCVVPLQPPFWGSWAGRGRGRRRVSPTSSCQLPVTPCHPNQMDRGRHGAMGAPDLLFPSSQPSISLHAETLSPPPRLSSPHVKKCKYPRAALTQHILQRDWMRSSWEVRLVVVNRRQTLSMRHQTLRIYIPNRSHSAASIEWRWDHAEEKSGGRLAAKHPGHIITSSHLAVAFWQHISWGGPAWLSLLPHPLPPHQELLPGTISVPSTHDATPMVTVK